MKLEQLRYIVEIADSQSITVAAKKLHVSQPNVTQSVANLEGELEVIIFKRTRFGSVPTEDGKKVIDNARSILSQMNDIKFIGKENNKSLMETISIGAVPSSCMTILPMTLSVLKNKYPNINMEIEEGGSMKIIKQVLNNDINIGIVSRRNMKDFSGDLVFEPLLSGRVVACVGKTHSYAGKKNISFREIIQHPIVIFNKEYRMNSFILNLLEQYGKPRILLTTGNTEVLKRVILEGIAIGFYPNIALKNDLYIDSGHIIPLEIKDKVMDNQNSDTVFGIIYPKKSYLSIATKKVIEEIKIQTEIFITKNNLSQ